MHMADALVSPAVGGTLWAASAGLLAYCARKVRRTLNDRLVPMMGVLGAFIFAAQMVNFSIPGTGSSGHLGGGLVLTVLLGPCAAFLVMASVLTVQALFFADGGLLALGCNIFNLGFFPAFIAYPLVYRVIARGDHTGPRAWIAAVAAAVAGLELGALGVVLETKASGLSELPFGAFALFMLPVHLAIGVVEGLATAAVVSFVARARPETLPDARTAPEMERAHRPVLAGLVAVAVLLGGVLSWFASARPDGLEWSIAGVTGKEEIAADEGGVHGRLARLQEKVSFLPDYGFKSSEREAPAGTAAPEGRPAAAAPWPAVEAGTSVSGLVGGLVILGLVSVLGCALRPRRAPE